MKLFDLYAKQGMCYKKLTMHSGLNTASSYLMMVVTASCSGNVCVETMLKNCFVLNWLKTHPKTLAAVIIAEQSSVS